MKVEKFEFYDLKIFSYIISDEATGQCAIIDPPRVTEPLVGYMKARDLKPVAVLETHVHADFVSGALELQKIYGPDLPIYCSAMGGPDWIPLYANRQVKDADTIHFGTVLLQAKHTPGHTPEHVSWIYYDDNQPNEAVGAFTGDFLFVGGVGRPDLLGANVTPTLLHELYESVFDRFADLPDALILYPAHGSGSLCGKRMGSGSSSTLGAERRSNPSFKKVDRQVWMDAIQEDMPGVPHTFARNKRINKIGAPLLSTLPKDKMEISREELQHIQSTGQLFDLRSVGAFCKEHLTGSVFLPLGTGSFGNAMASVIEERSDCLFIVPELDNAAEVSQLVRVLGYDQQLYFSTWKAVADLSSAKQSLPLISAKEAYTRISSAKPPLVLDVRTPEEWRNGHIANAQRIELSLLPNRISSLPKQPIIAFCKSGNRSCVAASLLQRAGYTDVANLEGGIESWQLASLPLEKST